MDLACVIVSGNPQSILDGPSLRRKRNVCRISAGAEESSIIPENHHLIGRPRMRGAPRDPSNRAAALLYGWHTKPIRRKRRPAGPGVG